MKAESIDKLLPQTQCKECSYDGCQPYAEAMANGSADIDLCPPGGEATLKALAKALNKSPEPYLEKVIANTRAPVIASIREEECIGCTKCIQACPVDAIIGSNKQMHTVISDLCTGCNLCVEPCPVDCIDLLEIDSLSFDKIAAKQRFNKRNQRLFDIESKKRQHYQAKKNLTKNNDADAKKAYILGILKKKKLNKEKDSS